MQIYQILQLTVFILGLVDPNKYAKKSIYKMIGVSWDTVMSQNNLDQWILLRASVSQ